MKTVFKFLACVLCVICLLVMIAGCNAKTSLTFTYNVDTGDAIRIKLDTTGGYEIATDLPFQISCNGELLSHGTFIQAEAYAQYISAVETDANAKMLDSGIKDGNEYIFWSYDEENFYYAVLITDSNTGIVLGNDISEESAKECFNRLTITVED